MDADRGGAGGGADAKRQCVEHAVDAQKVDALLEVAMEVGRGYGQCGDEQDSEKALRTATEGKMFAIQSLSSTLLEHARARLDKRVHVTNREIELADAAEGLLDYGRKYDAALANVTHDEFSESVRRAENGRCAGCAQETDAKKDAKCMTFPCRHMCVCRKCAEQLKLGTHFALRDKCPIAECRKVVKDYVQPSIPIDKEISNCLAEMVEGR